MLRRELVDEERWISGERFNRLLAVYQVLPGPEATELAVHMGFLRGGRVGAVVAGLGFTLPGFVLMLVLSWLYFQVDLAQPAIAAAFLGVQIAVVALVVRAAERIGRHIVVSPVLGLVALAAALATLAGVSFVITLAAAGIVHVAAGRLPARGGLLLAALATGAAAVALALAISAGTTVFGAGDVGPIAPLPIREPSTLDVFASGLKAGLLTFGGAYTAIPFVRADAVGSGWLTDAQFLDGLALSGILPAPLIIFASFVGYVSGGFAGALAMTAGIFVPAFAFALVLGERIEAVVERPTLHRLLEGVAAGVVGLIAVTAADLGLAVAARTPSAAAGLAIFVSALVLFSAWRSRAAVPAVLAGAAAAGWLAFGGLTG
jgi:chromate transporter